MKKLSILALCFLLITGCSSKPTSNNSNSDSPITLTSSSEVKSLKKNVTRSDTLQNGMTWSYIKDQETILVEGEGKLTFDQFEFDDPSDDISYSYPASDSTNKYKDETVYHVVLDEGITEIDEIINSLYRTKDDSKELTLSLPSTLTGIGSHTFYKFNVKEITLPSSIKTINFGAFSDCTTLESMTIPENVLEIGSNAFENCTSLKEVNFNKNLKHINKSAFYNCKSLSSPTLPDHLESIGKYAFVGCPFDSVTIPSSVTRINNYAFGFESLKIKESYDSKYDDKVSDISKMESFTLIGDKNGPAKKYADEFDMTFKEK